MSKETERFVKSRTVSSSTWETSPMELPHTITKEDAVVLPFRRLPIEEVRPFQNCVPLYELRAAAGQFSDEQKVNEIIQGQGLQDITEIEWVELPDAFRSRRDLFVAQVVGESMNRRIPNGAWCLFRLNPGGTRQGKVVLVQHRDISDSDTGGHYTVKVYESKKKFEADGTWSHSSITLRPDTTAEGYTPIVLEERPGEELRVIAELVAVIG